MSRVTNYPVSVYFNLAPAAVYAGSGGEHQGTAATVPLMRCNHDSSTV